MSNWRLSVAKVKLGKKSATGWLCSQDGYLLTCGHIFVEGDVDLPLEGVAGGGLECFVIFPGNDAVKATVVRYWRTRDKGADLAVIKVAESVLPKGICPPPIGKYEFGCKSATLYGYADDEDSILAPEIGRIAGYVEQSGKSLERDARAGLLKIECRKANVEGFSGSPVYCDDTGTVVAIQSGGGYEDRPDKDCVYAMPISRAEELLGPFVKVLVGVSGRKEAEDGSNKKTNGKLHEREECRENLGYEKNDVTAGRASAEDCHYGSPLRAILSVVLDEDCLLVDATGRGLPIASDGNGPVDISILGSCEELAGAVLPGRLVSRLEKSMRMSASQVIESLLLADWEAGLTIAIRDYFAGYGGHRYADMLKNCQKVFSAYSRDKLLMDRLSKVFDKLADIENGSAANDVKNSFSVIKYYSRGNAAKALASSLLCTLIGIQNYQVLNQIVNGKWAR